jgi:hypothetical protein
MSSQVPEEVRVDEPAEDAGVGRFTHRLRFKMPACHRHFFKGHKWWCRKCDRHTEIEMREVVHELWTLQGAGDRIDHD